MIHHLDIAYNHQLHLHQEGCASKQELHRPRVSMVRRRMSEPKRRLHELRLLATLWTLGEALMLRSSQPHCDESLPAFIDETPPWTVELVRIGDATGFKSKRGLGIVS